MTRVGIKALKARLSEFLSLARSGERVVITDRGRDVVELVPIGQPDEIRALWALVDAGKARWAGGKPDLPEPVAIRGRPISETVLEDRG